MLINVAVDIGAPPTQVWNDVRDIASHVEWMADAASISFDGDQREGVGTSFEVETRVGPLRTVDHMTVTEWVEGEIIGVAHRGLVVGTGRFTLEPVADRTTFRWSERLSLPLRFGGRVGEIVAKPVLTAIWKRNLRGLKRRIERGAGAIDTDVPRQPGPLVGQGRDGDVREFGPGRVIRVSRSRSDRTTTNAVLAHVAAHGVPVPAVHDHPDPTVTVMDRIDGVSMMADLATRPWRLVRHARLLAELHEQLHAIPPPDGLPRMGPGDELLHLDLHPDNIMLTDDGPVVLDWDNAAVGSGDLDVALTWVIIKTGTITANPLVRPLLEALRERFVSTYERAAGEERIRANAAAAAELRLLDDNLLPAERDAVFRLARHLQDRPLHTRTDDA